MCLRLRDRKWLRFRTSGRLPFGRRGIDDRADAVKFLRDCEADGMKLENCPANVRSGWKGKKLKGASN